MTLMRTVAIGLCALFMFLTSAMAQDAGAGPLRIVVDDGVVKPLPIAVPDFLGADATAADFGARIAAVVSSDLQSSGLFRPVPHDAFIEKIANFNAPPRFPDWRAINVQGLVSGQVLVEPDGRLRVQFRLWDVLAKQQMVGLQYYIDPDIWRRVAHKVADAIYSRLTGESGYFDSRIVFVEEAGPKGRRVKRLAIMDQDGANVRYLTGGGDLVLTPRFSPTDLEVTYISYKGGDPQVYLLNIETGQQEILGHFPGMTFAPRFSPDGGKVIMSLAQNGNTDLYLMDLATRRTKRLTDSPSIETGPSFSPDGSQIVFESDRGGSQQIYVMNANGGEARRISFGKGRYGTPVWSPRGDMIAFTKMNSGKFHIGVMQSDGSDERLLTESFLDEGPTWAPNGRVLMFFRETPGESGAPGLWSVDITGRNLRRVKTPQAASDPAWSPLLN